MERKARRALPVRILARVPVVGYAIRCIEEERETELLSLVGVLLLAAIDATLIWGWPAFITIMLAAVVLAGLGVVSLTID